MRIECPICKKVLPDVPVDFGPRPFCSATCKMVDLGNWLNEAYRIPVSSDEAQLDTEDHSLS